MITVNVYNKFGIAEPFSMPENWQELSAEQFIKTAGILYSKSDDTTIRINLLKALGNFRWEELNEIGETKVATDLLHLTDWLAEPCDITTQLIPSITAHNQTFYGPKDYLQNTRFAEFDSAERAFCDWTEDPHNLQKLYYFVATLYRPKRKNYDTEKDPEGDLREPFNGNLTNYYSQIMSDIFGAPAEQAYAIILFFKACRAFMQERHPKVFTAPTENTLETNEPGYYQVIRMIAKEGTYGTYEQVEQLYTYNALLEMEAAADERKALEDAMNEAKTALK